MKNALLWTAGGTLQVFVIVTTTQPGAGLTPFMGWMIYAMLMCTGGATALLLSRAV